MTALRFDDGENDLYTALSPEHRQIRLLRFDVNEGWEVHGKLEVVSLNDSPQYEALSYAWEDHTTRQMISINGSPFEVTRGCYDALRTIKRNRQSQSIWLDQICINQHDTQDKVHQVAMMDDIYGSASKVIAYLGYEDTGHEIATAIQDVSSAQGSMQALRLYSAPAMRRLLDDFNKIVTKPLWRRVWIFQELLLARQVVVMSGNQTYDLEQLLKLNGFLRTTYGDAYGDGVYWSEALHLLDYFSKLHAMSFSDAMLLSSGLQASDPRDKVFVWLSVIKWPEGRPPFLPDYSRSVASMAVDLLTYCDGSLDTLSNLLGALNIHGNDGMTTMLIELNRSALHQPLREYSTVKSQWQFKPRCALRIEEVRRGKPVTAYVSSTTWIPLGLMGAVRIALQGNSEAILQSISFDTWDECILQGYGSHEQMKLLEQYLKDCKDMQRQSFQPLQPSEEPVAHNGRAVTDSGYGTKSSHAPDTNHEKDMDSCSIQTDGRMHTMPGDTSSQLISEFVDRIIENLSPKECANARGHITGDPGSLESMLRDYAVLLRGKTSGAVDEQAVTFIRHQRRQVAKALVASIASWKSDASDAMPLSDKVALWERLQASDTKEGHVEAEQGSDIALAPMENDWGDDLELLITQLQDDAPLPSEVPRARDFLLDGDEFLWLLRGLRRHITTTQTGSASTTIRTQLAAAIEKCGSKNLELELHWPLLYFLEEQYDGNRIRIDNVIVLCGDGEQVYATTVGEYIRMMWPTVADLVMECLQKAYDATDSRYTCESQDNSLQVRLMLKWVLVDIAGEVTQKLECAEAFVWLATACKAYDRHEKAAYCVAELEATNHELPMTVRPTCHLIEGVVSENMSQCWLQMLHNPVVAQGYPVPRRHHPEAQRGLEIEWNLMIGLSHATWATTFAGAFVLKGLVSALVPVLELSNCLVWHLYLNKDGSRMSYNQACLQINVLGLPHLDVDDLKRRRHFIGLWTPCARIMAGTNDSTLYEFELSHSKPIDHYTVSLTNVSIGAAKIVTAGVILSIGKKDIAAALQESQDNPFERQIQDASSINVLFFGGQDRRGWLLDGASALRHLARAWLSSESARFVHPSVLEKFHHMAGNGGKAMALDTLMSNKRQVLRLFDDSAFTQERSCTQQVSDSGVGGSSDSGYVTGAASSETTLKHEDKMTTSEWTVKDLVMNLWRILEAMSDRLGALQRHAPEFHVKKPTNKPVLLGWEAEPVITDRGPYLPRALPLDSRSGHWNSFIKDTGAVVLFARTFGDLIRPEIEISGCWRTSPLQRNCDFLAVPVYLWRKAAKKHASDNEGSSHDCVQVADYTYWRNFDPHIRPCRCKQGLKCNVVSRLDDHANVRAHHNNVAPFDIILSCPNGVAIIGDLSKVQPLHTEMVDRSDPHVSLENQIRGDDCYRYPLQRGNIQNCNLRTLTEQTTASHSDQTAYGHEVQHVPSTTLSSSPTVGFSFTNRSSLVRDIRATFRDLMPKPSASRFKDSNTGSGVGEPLPSRKRLRHMPQLAHRSRDLRDLYDRDQ